MNCTDFERELAAESGGLELEAHLESCQHCREFAQELEKNAAALRELTVPPAAFLAVRERVLAEIQRKKRRAIWWAWPVAAAACMAILCVSYVIPRLGNPAAPQVLVAKKEPPRIEWALAQPVVRRVRHKSSGRSVAQVTPARKTEPVAVVKMLTNDPNVIIIWLVDQKGDSL